jgi:hypothetical protein
MPIYYTTRRSGPRRLPPHKYHEEVFFNILEKRSFAIFRPRPQRLLITVGVFGVTSTEGFAERFFMPGLNALVVFFTFND